MKKIALITLSICASLTSAWAETCPKTGYVLKLTEPAKTEDGWVRLTQYTFQTPEFRVHPAEYEIMNQKEYSTLDKEMTYEAYQWVSEKISVSKISPVTDISNYDIINTLDGGVLNQPLKKPIITRVLENHEIETPRRREMLVESKSRPVPKRLEDGRLKVMISPEYYESLANGGSGGLQWMHYIKTRSPAIYQQVKCDEEK